MYFEVFIIPIYDCNCQLLKNQRTTSAKPVIETAEIARIAELFSSTGKAPEIDPDEPHWLEPSGQVEAPGRDEVDRLPTV
ncbi:MAG TPA: hypothetical protein VFE91_07845 [Nitrososphaerales archaeon]|nr:hypothetical protein [Nitrososphaerales archaeon]